MPNKPSLLLGPLVGGLSHNSANIWVRANAPARMHVWLARRPDVKDAEWVGEAGLYTENACAGVVPLSKLKPNTRYYYSVSLTKRRPSQKDFHAFSTFPKPGTDVAFNFAFGSCYLPPDEHGGQTLDELHRRVDSDQLRFGLMIGDQIYADAKDQNGLGRVAVTLDDYRAVYKHNWSRPAMRSLMPDLPLFMTLDDHEVDNDWRWTNLERTEAEISIIDRVTRWFKRVPLAERSLSLTRVRAALKAYDEHQMWHAPDPLLPFEFDEKGEYMIRPNDAGALAYTFYYGNAAFFVLDTRTMRVTGKKKTMLGEGQWLMLEHWLKEVNAKYPVKFLVTSCSVLHPLWIDIVNDRWSGFRRERERLLELLAVNEIEGVRILTGDLHSTHAVTAELKCPSGRRIPIAEFCASPFEQESIWISFTYGPLFSKWLARQKRHFYHACPNFGIVNVSSDSPDPRVTFTINYNDNGEWKEDFLMA